MHRPGSSGAPDLPDLIAAASALRFDDDVTHHGFALPPSAPDDTSYDELDVDPEPSNPSEPHASAIGDAPIDDALAARIAAQHMFVTATLSIMAAFNGASLGPSLADDPRIAPFLTDMQRQQLTKAPPGKDHPMAPIASGSRIADASRRGRAPISSSSTATRSSTSR
jgi:hypothetical protein